MKKNSFWSAALSKCKCPQNATTVAREWFDEHNDPSYVTLWQTVLPNRSPIDITFYIVKTDLVTQEHPAAPKVSKHAYTFERGEITYLNSMSFLPQS